MSTDTSVPRRSSSKNGEPRELVTAKSHEWHERAQNSLAGGISSSARMVPAGAPPLYITHGWGSRIWDADENEYVDFLNSYGSTILGHANPGLVQAVSRQLALGTMFGTCNTLEVELAERIQRMVPCAQLVRFANSGSEAICGAIRAARGFTGKNKILKFEGHYHGWVDVLAISNRPSAEEWGPLQAPASRPHSPGIPSGVVQDVIICPWNDPDILRSMLDRHGSELAAVIAEPIVANNACIMPQPGYLQALRDECTRRGIVLIFDEICTGFRVAPGGAQQLFGVIPDLACYSKSLGGGFPISAFAGIHKIMDLIASNKVKHGGTYNGNPLCAAAAIYTLDALADPTVQGRIHNLGQEIIEGIRRSARDHSIPCIVQGVGPMFQVVFTSDATAPRHYRDLQRADWTRFARWRQALLDEQVHVNTSGSACWFVSAAHTPEDVKMALSAVEKAMRVVAC
jgi:glutamate-1-semialdehyde 2,1-aminomutase